MEYGSSSYMKVKVKVTGPKGKKSLFPQCKTLIGNNSGSIKQGREVCMQHRVFPLGGSNDVTAIFVS